MKVTDEMIETVTGKLMTGEPSPLLIGDVRAGLEAVLKDVPEVKEFRFSGYEGRPVYLHPCGTVVDVDPAHTGIEGTTMQGVLNGDCDCEGGQPWMRIYVEAQA